MVGFNWKCKKDYAFLENATSSQLAFEFLRRNTEYQSDYQAFSELKARLEKKYGGYETAREKWRADPIMWKLEPPIETGESIACWQKRVMTGGTPPEKEWLEFSYGRKWGLIGTFPNPNKPVDFDIDFYPPPDTFPQMPMLNGVLGEYWNYDPFKEVNGRAVIEFDLRGNLEPQIVIARKLLTTAQSSQLESGLITKKKKVNKPGNEASLLIRYLRILDAENGEEPHVEIGLTIFPYLDKNSVEDRAHSSKKVGDNLKPAKDYVKQKYRSIPFF